MRLSVLDYYYTETDMKAGELISCKEAAAILGISADRLRHIKKRFFPLKVGDKQQGRLLFRKDTLLKCYFNN